MLEKTTYTAIESLKKVDESKDSLKTDLALDVEGNSEWHHLFFFEKH